MDAFGTAISMSLQYGVPLEVLVNKFSHTRFEPMGHTTNPDIRIAKSVVDYIFRWMGMTFIPGYREAASGQLKSSEQPAAKGNIAPEANGNGAPEIGTAEFPFATLSSSVALQETGTSRLEQAGALMQAGSSKANRDSQFAGFQSDAPTCDNCGSITVRNGNCYLCHNCGNSMGCS